MAQLNIRIDDSLKEQGDALFKSLGMNFSSAFNIFVSQAVREGGIPFTITTKTDPFYSESNMAHLKRVKADAESGRNMAIHEIIDVADD